MKKLVLAEKPSVARDIARVLNCNKTGNGFIEGNEYIVTWALGHLVTLSPPERYNPKFKDWNMEDLPIIPKKMKQDVIRQTTKQYNTVKAQMIRKDVGEIIIATDAGREGELVARWIIEKANVKKPIKRLWISSVTDKAIKEGFKNLKDGKKYEGLYDSAVARAEADWVVGINGTRALTVKYNTPLSCGRVQTPTLSMVYEREEEIKNFVPKTFYGMKVVSGGLNFIWIDENNSSQTFNLEKRDEIYEKIGYKDLKIVDKSEKNKKVYPKGLYDLTELQRDANRVFGYSPKETLSIMQSLYESHKVLTYPRTDSKFISEDIIETLEDRVKACNNNYYGRYVNKILNSKIKTNKSFVDNKKVTDHHAIIPTEEKAMISRLSEREFKIYDLVVKRFLAVLYPPYEYEETTLVGQVEDIKFTTKGKVEINKGFKDIYENMNYEDEELEESNRLPNINKGDILKVENSFKTEGYTNPPPYYNEGTLLGAMENPVKYMSDESKKLKSIIKETGGIGTVATRADIMEKLFKTFLIEEKGKDIRTTSKGRQLLELVPEDLKSPTLTAEWEESLIKIEKNQLKKEVFIEEMKDYAKKIVDEIKSSDEEFKHDNLTRSKCPDCGKFLLEVNNKRGKMHVCQDRQCGYRKNVVQITNARCPQCKKKLELRGEGEGKTFYCSCGYREKLSSFNKRKQEKGKNLSKREVNKYLKKQDKEEDLVNNPMADALSKFKF